jgi:4-aminobutyrate aminotransferase
VHGLGLMLGIDAVDAEGQPDPGRAGELVEKMLAAGFILLSGGVRQNVLSFTPPFVISRAEIDLALTTLEKLGG